MVLECIGEDGAQSGIANTDLTQPFVRRTGRRSGLLGTSTGAQLNLGGAAYSFVGWQVEAGVELEAFWLPMKPKHRW